MLGLLLSLILGRPPDVPPGSKSGGTFVFLETKYG